MIVRLIILELILASILFGFAGRFDLPWFWALLGAHGVLMTAAIRSIEPDLMRERFRPAPGGEDRSLRWFMMPFLLAQLVIGSLDAGRFGWSGPFPPVVHGIGLLLFVGGMALVLRAMIVNRFFSPVVRIQEERGHRLITGGPYRFVRHPGYVGMLLAFAGVGFVLGSWWSFLTLIPVVVLILRRTILEDRYLMRNLQGYVRYSEQVRYRLLPGVW